MAPRSKKNPIHIDEAPQADANITVGEFGTDAPGTPEGTDGGTPEAPGGPEGSEEPDSQPEPEFVAYTAPRFNWTESIETRKLFVLLDHDDLQEVSKKLAQNFPDIIALQREAKSAASHYKSKIETLEVEQAELSDIILAGRRETSVSCTWEYECSGIDEFGERIFNADYKALFRNDTGEFVESARIQASERQMALALPEGEQQEPTTGGEEGTTEQEQPNTPPADGEAPQTDEEEPQF